MKDLTGSTATEIILAAELADYDLPTLSLTDADCLRLHGMGIACDDDNRTTEAA